MQIQDFDNMCGFEATDEQYKKIKAAIENEEITNWGGVPFEIENCLDGHSNICLDEEGYNLAKELVGR